MVEFRDDGILRNSILAYGDATDPEKYNRPDTDPENYTTTELEAIYQKDPIPRKAVAKVPNLAVSKGFTLKLGEQPADAALMRSLRSTKIIERLGEATKLARIYYRGAAVVLLIDDGQGPYTWDKPVHRNSIKTVQVGFVADGDRIFPSQQNIIGLPPTHYEMNLADAESWNSYGAESASLSGYSKIHRDRVLWLEGPWTPPSIRVKNNGSISFLSGFLHHYLRYEAAKKALIRDMDTPDTINVKRRGLNLFLAAASKEEQNGLRKEASTYRQSVKKYGVVISDREDTEFDVIKKTALTGVKDALDELRFNVVASSGGLTELDLFGLSTQTNGLNSNSLQARIAVSDAVDELRESQWREPLEYFLELMFSASEGPTNGKDPGEWAVEFPSALTLSPVEKADLYSKYAAADKTYYDIGVPKQVLIESRFLSGSFEPDISLPENWQSLAEKPKPPSDIDQQT
jgi:hypothetical protein